MLQMSNDSLLHTSDKAVVQSSV